VRSATLSGHIFSQGAEFVPPRQSRRLDLHQHDAVYKTAASLFGHVGSRTCTHVAIVAFRSAKAALLSRSERRLSSTSARIRTPSDGFGDRLLSQEHARVVLLTLRVREIITRSVMSTTA
jgi:hypothetical protein